jgi:hypothetical protein
MSHENNGPVFESGPGWGEKIKKWFGRYFYKLVLPIIFLALVSYGIAFRNKTPETSMLPTETPTPMSLALISQVVLKSDGKILVARRAVADYLASHTDLALSPAQKMYLETVLAEKIDNKSLFAGNTINFNDDDISSAIEKSMYLSPSQVLKWSEYARKAGIK